MARRPPLSADTLRESPTGAGKVVPWPPLVKGALSA